jgi:hypothetical protein
MIASGRQFIVLSRDNAPHPTDHLKALIAVLHRAGNKTRRDELAVLDGAEWTSRPHARAGRSTQADAYTSIPMFAHQEEVGYPND